ncbi:hypothetical protein [Allorhizocola rhizosphaerae]|uniref:hypothetical protein n=1 Tax=Allorhizocola rhizosphaerae TaxID=1872709 RepID=UPI000E3C3402|nr:hypothetical protein [Allorhizocola rhizosphaerae]
MRIRFLFAAVVAMLAMSALSAAPASAASGWIFHSGGYTDEVFVEYPCLDKGYELVTAGVIADYQCRHNPSTQLTDLYIVYGPWTFHSGGYNDDIFFNNPCFDTGQALVANGSITTFKCQWAPNTDLSDLWIIV